MTATLKSYSEMKASGVPWLGTAPAHWKIMPLKRIGRLSGGTGFPIALQGNLDEEILFVKVSDMNKQGNERRIVDSANTVSWRTVQDLGAQVFSKNTIVFPKVGGALLTNKRRFLARKTCIDNNLMACVVMDADKDFVFRMLGWLDLARISKPGPVPAISEGEVREIRVAVPTLPEQIAIARFLDHADWRIRRYIRAKQKLIALLEEQKQATIHQAVTGQIDVRTGQPYPAYKPSGVEWLGNVPKDWDVTRIRFLFKEIDSRSTTGQETHLSMSQVLGLVPSPMVERALIADSYVGGKLCEKDDLVLNRLKAHLGVFALAKQPGVVSPDYSVFRGRGSEAMEYFEKVCQLPALKTEFRVRAKGIVEGFWRLYTEDLFDIRLPVPSYLEQRTIANYVTETVRNIGHTVSHTQRQIELLHEYRTRLIADVVTGKLDVHEAAADLPEMNPLAKGNDPDDTFDTNGNSARDELDFALKGAEA